VDAADVDEQTAGPPTFDLRAQDTHDDEEEGHEARDAAP